MYLLPLHRVASRGTSSRSARTEPQAAAAAVKSPGRAAAPPRDADGPSIPHPGGQDAGRLEAALAETQRPLSSTERVSRLPKTYIPFWTPNSDKY